MKIMFLICSYLQLFDFEYAFLSNPAANLGYCLVGYLFFYQIEKNSDANHTADKPKSDIPALKVAYAQGARHVGKSVVIIYGYSSYLYNSICNT